MGEDFRGEAGGGEEGGGEDPSRTGGEVSWLDIADLFCGAGGSSLGAIEAAEKLGHRPRLTAINHWPIAIATHAMNIPGEQHRHLCSSLDSVNPRELYRDGELDALWASPECTHHSTARGGRPINDQSRATAWCVVRWLEALMPPVLWVENVPEFRTWGPIGTNGRPIKRLKGAIFGAWLQAIRALGYQVDQKILCAADFGDPTTRRRLFVMAVRGRRKIVWPNATHAPTGKVHFDMFRTQLKPWVAAREIIDWKLEGQSIFERKRPLSPKTMRRILAGLEKFGLRPFIVPGFNEREGQSPRTHDIERPLPTVAASGHTHVAEPVIVGLEHTGSNGCEARPVSEPVSTISGKARKGVAEPVLIKLRGGSKSHIASSSQSVDEPVPALTANGQHLGLADAVIIPQNSSNAARSVNDPAPTVTTTSRGVGLAQPFLVQVHMAKPHPRKNPSKRRVKSVDEPMPTVKGSNDFGVVEPALLPQQSGGELRPITQPVPTVATDGAIGLVEPFLVKFYGTGRARPVSIPLDAVTTKDRFGLVKPQVEIDGERYILDIRFRMLQPHELSGAQGFPKGFRFSGNKTEQVKQIGNANPRRLTRAIAAASLSQNPDVSWLGD